MRGNEPIPDPDWGSSPELGLTMSEQRICTCRPGGSSLGSEVGGEEAARRQPPKAGSVTCHPMASFQNSPHWGAVMGSNRPGPRKEGGAHRIRNIPNIRAPMFFLHPWLLQGESQALGAGDRGREQRKSQK